MSIISESIATCSCCGNRTGLKIYKSINTSEDPSLKEKVKDGSLFIWKCPSCGQANLAKYDTLYHDPDRKLMIWLLKDENVSETQMHSITLHTKAIGNYTLRRVTDTDTLKVVTMVYAGWCSKSIVALLQKHGCNAVGLSGADADLIRATRRPPVRKAGQADEETVTIDYGYVGDVDPHMINAGFLYRLTDAGITPVICAITHDGNGSLLNTNADTIASSVAVSLAACRQGLPDGISCGKPENRPEVSLVYCFEKDGVLYDKDDDSSVIPGITPEYYSRLKREGRVAAGMIPKLDNAFNALEHGVKEVVIKHAGNLGNGIGTVLSL